MDSRSGKVLSRDFYDTSICNLKNEEFHLRLNTFESLANTATKKKRKKTNPELKDEAGNVLYLKNIFSSSP